MRSHTSPRWTGTEPGASKPSLTFPAPISRTVTVRSRSRPSAPPTTTVSELFRDKTSIAGPPCSRLLVDPTAPNDDGASGGRARDQWWLVGRVPGPRARGDRPGHQED